jgi:nucleotide-binding universal stress UspA family protein
MSERAMPPIIASPAKICRGGTMNTIVIATDGSQCALDAENLGLELAAAEGAEAIFVHVAPQMDVLPTLGFAPGAAIPHELTDDDRRALERGLRLAGECGVEARSELLRGQPVDEVVAYADSIDADLIVVGSRGHGGFTSALLGSVSRGILHEARRPVLIARGVRSRALATTAA